MIAPTVSPVTPGPARPLWSVMIPTFNCAKYLGETLRSVLRQDRGPELMQIEVVDDASTGDDPEAVVREIGHGRVAFYRKPRNEGAIANFNTCIARSRGELVHILHGDDLVADGYYGAVERLANDRPEVGLYATRCFYIDEDSVITGVTKRVRPLERPANSVAPFFYETPVQFAGITVRRAAYERLGGFRSDLVHTADCEMWARVIGGCQGVISEDVLAFYRVFAANDSGRLARTAENIRDLARLSSIFAASYPEFSRARAVRVASTLAWKQYRRFKGLGDETAAEANYKIWVDLTTPADRLIRRLRMFSHLVQRRVLS